MELTLHEDIILLKQTAASKEEILSRLVEALTEQGAVKSSFKQAILAREIDYPTGLPFEGFGVAIPHTDVEHVIRPSIACAVLSQPVAFELMGSPGEEVWADLIFMLAVTEPKKQVKVLENLMAMCQKSEIIRDLQNASSEKEVVAVLRRELQPEA